jgi:sortase A
MGNRSQMRKFKKRRQRAGFVLLASLAIIILGVTLFFRLDPFQRASESVSVERVAVPMIGSAPEAVAEDAGQPDAAAEKTGSRDGVQKEGEKKQQAEAEQPGIPAPATSDLWMTIPKLGLYDNFVTNSNAHSALDYGAAKREETGFPWQDGANTYISAHRLGWPGTASDHQFYNLPSLAFGDKVYLYDANGTTYTYEVTEIFEVAPNETWVTDSVPGRDMVSLQTCIENYGDYWTMGPNWYVRYVVRADRVDITPA